MFDMIAGALHAPFLPGHGPTPELATSTFEDAADRLEETLTERFGDAAVDVLGYSMGARLALAFCARHPRRFRRAMLVSGHPGLTTDTERAERSAEDEANAQLVESKGLGAFVDAWEQKPLFASQKGMGAEALRAQRATRTAHTAPGIAWSLRNFGLAKMPDYGPAIAELAPRLQLLVGALDGKFVDIAARLGTQHPALGVEILPALGHNIFLEAPALTLRRIDRFFAGTSSTRKEQSP